MNPPEPPAVFEEPWQAQAFALTVHLHQTGAFSWAEWTTTLGEVIATGAARGEAAGSSRYYHHWLDALEALVARRGLTDPDSLARVKADWARAYQETAHGQPVELGAAPSSFYDRPILTPPRPGLPGDQSRPCEPLSSSSRAGPGA